MSVARADLGPLAARFPDLLRPLKETLLALARPRSEPALKQTPPSVLAAALQVLHLYLVRTLLVTYALSLCCVFDVLVQVEYIRNLVVIHTRLMLCSGAQGSALCLLLYRIGFL